MAGTGGKRPGAGRKPTRISTIIKKLPKNTAAMILSEINEGGKWTKLLESSDENVVLKSLIYLTDRRDGKPKQSIEASGPGGGPIEADVKVTLVRPDGSERTVS